MSVVIRADDEPVKTRLDYWRHVLGELFGPLHMPVPENLDFRDELLLGDLGPVHVADLYVDQPSRGARTERHIRQSAHDVYMISIPTRGRCMVEQHGRQAVYGPGDLAFLDLAQPYRLAAGRARVTEIVFPHTLLPLHANDLTRATAVRIPGDHSATALASSLGRQLSAHLADTDGAHAARLGTTVLDLLTVAVAAHVDRDRSVPPETRQRALLVRIRAFIEEHLADPELSPATVAAAHFISLRYLHKLFEAEETTVADLIRRRRLERCRQDLLDPTQRTLPVSAIAARWGFTDPAHFSRLFRATHGLPPAHYRHLATTKRPI